MASERRVNMGRYIKTQVKRIISLLLVAVTLFSNMTVAIATEEAAELSLGSTTTKTLYRYREKVETTSRFPLEEPWNLISKTDSPRFLREYNNLAPDELARLEKQYSDDYCYTTKIDDGTISKFSTRPHGGAVYYYEESFLYGPYCHPG